MMKVVYNNCYGGFSLSEKAVEAYLTRSEVNFVKVPVVSNYKEFKLMTAMPSDRIVELMGASDWYWEDLTDEERVWCNEHSVDSDRDIVRHDPILVAIVEEMGDEANGTSASLCIEDIEGDRYMVREYDGMESIVEPKDMNWIIA